ncbi:hypothetical protein A4X06_0g8877 [Tilletia controversa]|uniref:Uncharacterized protein n=2 Tax=Tilletia TaxID=13289 RepID=A0A8X7MJA9_9BASI|nr:hypothetical protein A4X03_0g8906 [Tilletia caries]KAE8238309.1 hypothetical protein A4X06_0g8877 [Tilletia controversa]
MAWMVKSAASTWVPRWATARMAETEAGNEEMKRKGKSLPVPPPPPAPPASTTDPSPQPERPHRPSSSPPNGAVPVYQHRLAEPVDRASRRSSGSLLARARLQVLSM